jgi:hypothetical protein
LNQHEERKHRVTGWDAEQLLCDEQMCGGRHGDKFGQSLDNAEEEGVKDGHVISIPASQ